MTDAARPRIPGDQGPTPISKPLSPEQRAAEKASKHLPGVPVEITRGPVKPEQAAVAKRAEKARSASTPPPIPPKPEALAKMARSMSHEGAKKLQQQVDKTAHEAISKAVPLSKQYPKPKLPSDWMQAFIVVGSGADRHLKLRTDITASFKGVGEVIKDLVKGPKVAEFLKEQGLGNTIGHELVEFRDLLANGRVDDAIEYLSDLPEIHQEALIAGVPKQLLSQKDAESGATLLSVLVSDRALAPIANKLLQRLPEGQFKDASPLFYKACLFGNHEVAALLFAKIPRANLAAPQAKEAEVQASMKAAALAFLNALPKEMSEHALKALVVLTSMAEAADVNKQMPLFTRLFSALSQEQLKMVPIEALPFLNNLGDIYYKNSGDLEKVREAARGLIERFGADILNRAMQQTPACMKIATVIFEQMPLDLLGPTEMQRVFMYGPRTVLAKETAALLQNLPEQFYRLKFGMWHNGPRDLWEKVTRALTNLADNAHKTGIELNTLLPTIGTCIQLGEEDRGFLRSDWSDYLLERLLKNPPREVVAFTQGLRLGENFDGAFKALQTLDRPDLFLRMAVLHDPKVFTMPNQKTGQTFADAVFFGKEAGEAGAAVLGSDARGYAGNAVNALFRALPKEQVVAAFEKYFAARTGEEILEGIEEMPEYLLREAPGEKSALQEKYDAIREIVQKQLVKLLKSNAIAFGDVLEVVVDKMGEATYSKEMLAVLATKPEVKRLGVALKMDPANQVWEELKAQAFGSDSSLLIRAMPKELLAKLGAEALRQPIDKPLVEALGAMLTPKARLDSCMSALNALSNPSAQLQFIRDLPSVFLDGASKFIKTSLLAMLYPPQAVDPSHVLNVLLQRGFIKNNEELVALSDYMEPLSFEDVTDANRALVTKMRQMVEDLVAEGQLEVNTESGRIEYMKVPERLKSGEIYERIAVTKSQSLEEAATLLRKLPLDAFYGSTALRDLDVGELDVAFQNLLRRAALGDQANYTAARAMLVGMPGPYLFQRLPKMIAEHPVLGEALTNIVNKGLQATNGFDADETRWMVGNLPGDLRRWLAKQPLNPVAKREVERLSQEVGGVPEYRAVSRGKARPKAAIEAPKAEVVLAPRADLPFIVPPEPVTLLTAGERARLEGASLEALGAAAAEKLRSMTPSERGTYEAARVIDTARASIYKAYHEAEMAAVRLDARQIPAVEFDIKRSALFQTIDQAERGIKELLAEKTPSMRGADLEARDKAYRAGLTAFLGELRGLVAPMEQYRTELLAEFRALIPMAEPRREEAMYALATRCWHIPEDQWKAFAKELKALDQTTFGELEAVIEEQTAKAQDEAEAEKAAAESEMAPVALESIVIEEVVAPQRNTLVQDVEAIQGQLRAKGVDLAVETLLKSDDPLRVIRYFSMDLPRLFGEKTFAGHIIKAVHEREPDPRLEAFERFVQSYIPKSAEASLVQEKVKAAAAPEPKVEKSAAPEAVPLPAASEPIAAPLPPLSPRKAASSPAESESVPKARLNQNYGDYNSLERIEAAQQANNMGAFLRELAVATRPEALITHLNPRLKIGGQVVGEAILKHPELQNHSNFAQLKENILKMAPELAAAPVSSKRTLPPLPSAPKPKVLPPPLPATPGKAQRRASLAKQKETVTDQFVAQLKANPVLRKQFMEAAERLRANQTTPPEDRKRYEEIIRRISIEGEEVN